ncbi:unnamed protein product, partial [Brenthis ino]
MARYAHHIFKVHIADGFSNDCDELIHKCLQLRTLDYQTFCNFWKDFNFGMIYMGRTSGAEIAELTEEVIHIAKHYMVKDTSNIEESIAGLFLVYGLIKLQPYPGFACLRIVPDDLQAINRIEVVARRDRRLDVLYILGELLSSCSQYHAAERERGLEAVLRKYLEGYTSIDKLGVRPKGVFFRQNEELDIIRDLGSVTRQYARAKKSLIGDAVSDPSLQYINENLPNELNASLRKVINGIVEIDADSDDDDEDDDDHYSNVQAIKSKAMTNTVNPMKHLQGVSDRDAANPVLKSKPELKSPTGKIKTVSPTKPVTTSPKKRKAPLKRGKAKKARRKSKEKSETNISNENIELNLEEFKKVSANNEADGQCVSVEIEIEAIPPTKALENNGDAIEIEVIDNKMPEASNNSTKDNSDNKTESDESYDDETEDDECVNESGVDEVRAGDEVREMANVQTKMSMDLTRPSKRTRRDIPIIIEPIVRKKEKQDCKRNKIKSKFRKWGILPIANFKEK